MAVPVLTIHWTRVMRIRACYTQQPVISSSLHAISQTRFILAREYETGEE